jgi:hypothetical protein
MVDGAPRVLPSHARRVSARTVDSVAEGSTAPRGAVAAIGVSNKAARIKTVFARSPSAGHDADLTGLALGAGLAVLLAAALRLRVFMGATMPVIMPDEGGSWSIARLLARANPPILMRDLPAYPLGTGVLLAPVVRLIDGPVAQYRTGLLGLGLLVFIAAGLTAAFVQRLGVSDRRGTVACFVVVLLQPALTTTSSFTWSEALCAVALPAFLVAAQTAFRRVAGAAPAVAGAIAGVMPFVHARFTLVPLCWLLCLAVFLARARGVEQTVRLRAGASALLATGAAYIGCKVLYDAVVSRLWVDAPSPTALLRDSLGEPEFWTQLFRVLVGQAWYLGAASFGCALVGVVCLVGVMRRGPRGAMAPALSATMATSGLVLAVVFVTSAAPLATGTYADVASGDAVRADYFAYGRYIDPVMMVAAGLGVAVLFGRPDTRVVRRLLVGVLAALGVLAGLVWSMLPDERIRPFEPNIAGVWYLPLTGIDFDVVRWTILAAAAFVFIVVISRLGSRWSVAFLVALFGLAAFGASSAAMEVHDRWKIEPLYGGISPPEAERPVIAVAKDIELAATYRFASVAHEYVLTDQGWSFDFTPYSSEELQRRSPPEAGLMVLRFEQPVDESRWRMVGELGEARVWVRREP